MVNKKRLRIELLITSSLVIFAAMPRRTKLEHIASLLHNKYINTLLTQDVDSVVYKALVTALDDPYSEYLTPEEVKSFSDALSNVQTYRGIGIQTFTNETTGEVLISAVYDDSPAKRAGIHAGEIIRTINNEPPTSHLPTQGAVVSLVMSDGCEYIIEPDTIERTSVVTKILNDNIGLIIIEQFSDRIYTYFKKAVDELTAQGVTGLIIDLRYNTGGVLGGCLKCVDYLLPDDVLINIETKTGAVAKVGTDNHQVDLPIVVLVNAHSASASEVLAGALKDYKRATIVGTRTFGKNTIQTIFYLNDGSAVRLTTHRWYTPSGYSPEGVGIDPDIVVEMTSNFLLHSETDTQLKTACDLLTN